MYAGLNGGTNHGEVPFNVSLPKKYLVAADDSITHKQAPSNLQLAAIEAGLENRTVKAKQPIEACAAEYHPGLKPALGEPNLDGDMRRREVEWVGNARPHNSQPIVRQRFAPA